MKKLTMFTLIGLLIPIVSFKSPIHNDANNQLSKIEINENVEKFIKNLKEGKNLNSLFANNWTLIYHEDNRCTGSTDGKIDGLKSSNIDKTLTLKVSNDGDGWACEKTAPNQFDYDFDIKKLIETWDRFEIASFENNEKNTVYIQGAGDSDYIKLFYNESNLIIKMKYSSEDPG